MPQPLVEPLDLSRYDYDVRTTIHTVHDTRLPNRSLPLPCCPSDIMGLTYEEIIALLDGIRQRLLSDMRTNAGYDPPERFQERALMIVEIYCVISRIRKIHT